MCLGLNKTSVMASQFGAAKNPPWARPVSDFMAANAANTVSVSTLTQGQMVSALVPPGAVATPTVYSLGTTAPSLAQQQYNAQQLAAIGIQSQQALQQGAASAVLPQPGIAIPTTLATSQVATVSYPPPRASQPHGQKQRVFTGTVTKLHDNFGFVDEDVFFQTSCVKGLIPKVGSRVLVEATYNANMPFKWNATRIQVLPNQQAAQGPIPGLNMKPQPQSLPLATGLTQSIPQPVPPVPPPVMTTGHIVAQGLGPGIMSQQPPPLMAQNPQPSINLLPPGPRSGPPPQQSQHRSDPGRFPGIKEREKERERERERDRRDRRENRLKRPRSPNIQKARSPVSRPRSPVRRRQPRVIPRYIVQIPKLSFDVKEANVISLKARYGNLYIPSDFFHASFSWAEAFPRGRAFRLGSHCSFHVMPKDVEPLQPVEAVLDAPDADHLYSAKVMLLSSPLLEDLYHKACALAEDNSDAFQHPTRLLQFLVGIRGKNEPMAIGGSWSPSLDGPNAAENPQVLIKTAIRTTKALTGIDLSSCTQWYRFAEIRYLRPEGTHKGRQVPAHVETVVLFMPDIWTCSPTRLEWGTLQASYAKQLQRKMAALDGKDVPTQVEEETDMENKEDKKEPTHHASLDPKTMKIIDLRRELECRTLSSKGLKSQLIARLTKTLKQEKEEEIEVQPKDSQVKAEDKMEVDEKEASQKKEEDEKKKKEKREKAAMERKYSLPDCPAIIVHPSATAKGGKFDCAMMSLSVLLDYRPEDNKEHSFEVSLFAELFNEMLMRDFGFQIYRGLALAPPKKEDDKKDKDDIKKEKDKSKSENTKEPSIKKKKTDEGEKTEDKEKSKQEEEKKEKAAKPEDEKKEDDMEEEDNIEDDDDHEEIEHKEEDTEQGKKDKDIKKDKDKKREKKKFTTTDPYLLLSFVYFDQNHTGYLLDKDVEEILHTIGLHLSRAQIKKLLQKVMSRDTLNYRKLTDKPHPPGESDMKDDKNTAGISEEELALGNMELLKNSRSPSLAKTPEKQSRNNKKDSSSNIINYNGALLDIESLMQRLEKSEKSRSALETKLEEMTAEMYSMKSNLNSSEYFGQKLSAELRQANTELETCRSRQEEAEKCNKQWTKTVTESRDLISRALAAMSVILDSGTSSSSSAAAQEVRVKEEMK